MNDDDLFKLETFRENWNHYRQVINERLYFSQIYGAVVAAAIALSGFDLIDPPRLLIGVLYFGGLLGFGLNLKLTYEAINHIKKVDKIRNENSILKKYMAMPLNVGIFKVIKVQYIFHLFYIGLCSLWVWFLYPAIVIPQIIILVELIFSAEFSFQRFINNQNDTKKSA